MNFAARRVGVALLLAGAVVLTSCGSDEGAQYGTETVQTARVVERVSAPGSVQAANQADLTAPAAARIQVLHVQDGDQVRAGQVVAQLSSEEIEDAVRQAEEAVASADALSSSSAGMPAGQSIAALDAVQVLVRDTTNTLLQTLRTVAYSVPEPHRGRLLEHLQQAQQRLADARSTARSATEQAVNAFTEQLTGSLEATMVAAAQAQRAQAETALEIALEQREGLTLRSPINGTVQLGRASAAAPQAPDVPALGGGQLPPGAEDALEGLAGGGGGGQAAGPLLRVGSEVSSGQTVASILDVSHLTVATEVDETDIALVREEQLAEVELDAYPGEVFKGRVTRVAIGPTEGQASALGGVSYRVDLHLAPPVDPNGPMPRPGMTATVAIRVREVDGALSVASSALVGRGTGQAVYVIDEGGRVRLRPVELAAAGEERVAVASGVREGERVVTRGAERLEDGQEFPGS